ncbi:MAG: DUF885 family protein [Vicinamibacterales bacterium]
MTRYAWLATFGCSLLACSLTACTPPPPAGPTAEDVARHSRELTAYLDAEYEEQLKFEPESLTSQGRKELYDQLADRSDAGLERVLAWRRESVADMKARFDPAVLDEDARTSYDVWVELLNRAEKEYQFRHYPYLASETFGEHTGLPRFLMSQHRVETLADMEAYIARIGRIAEALDQNLARAVQSAAMNIRMPRFMYEKTAGEAAALVTGAPFGAGRDSAIYADGKEKIAALLGAGTIAGPQSDDLTRRLETAMREAMKPGYDRLIAWLKADAPNAPAEARGVGSLPNGRAWYDAALSLNTGLAMTADEIHALGLAEVARIRVEMEALKARAGFTGSLAEFFAFMRTSKRFSVPNTDAGRADYTQRSEELLAAVTAKLPQYFGLLPKAPLVVKRVEPFREVPGGAPHYVEGAPDGSRPGTFYLHLSDMSALPTYQLPTIAFHEGLPGHHLQISIQQERTDLPKFRTQAFDTAYVEGWGLYSEWLAKEMGFQTDPYDDFGRLSGEVWRAIRLVLDTGIHAKGWSEEQAVQYFLENSAQPEAAVRSEVRRYITRPGQATAYKIGMIAIQKLRSEAKAALGDRFDDRRFHDVVLGGGALPLTVLEQRVRRWTGTQAAAPVAN